MVSTKKPDLDTKNLEGTLASTKKTLPLSFECSDIENWQNYLMKWKFLNFFPSGIQFKDTKVEVFQSRSRLNVLHHRIRLWCMSLRPFFWGKCVEISKYKGAGTIFFPNFVLSGFWINCRKRKIWFSMKSELPSLRWLSIDKKAFERHLDENLKQRKLKTCSCGSRGMSRNKVNRAFLAHQNSTVKNKNKMFLFRKFHHKEKKLEWDLYARNQWILTSPVKVCRLSSLMRDLAHGY